MKNENETPRTRSEKAIRLHSTILALCGDDPEAALERLCYEVVDLTEATNSLDEDEPGDGFRRRVRSA